MFYVRYLRNELIRRRTRTPLTTLGLAIGVALVITISSLSRGLDRAQQKTLDPLSSIGTDLTVTLAPAQNSGGGFGGGGFGGSSRDLLQANQSAITDLSKLGKPGAHFVHDFFLPGTQLTFPQSQMKQIAALPGVARVSSGLMLSAVHQAGTVPKIVARFRTGGQTYRIRRQITPLSAAVHHSPADAAAGDRPSADEHHEHELLDRSPGSPRRCGTPAEPRNGPGSFPPNRFTIP